MAHHQPEQQLTESSSPLPRVTARIKEWTRQAMSPWVRQRLGGQATAQSHAGLKYARFSQVTVSGPGILTALKRVRRRSELGPGRKSLTTMAGAIFHRHRATKFVPPPSARPTSELVLAGGSAPAPAQSGQTPAESPAPGGFSMDQLIPPLPPTQTGFSVGQHIPPIPSTETGFSVGQRIPPMPKSEPKKQPPAGQKTRQKAGPTPVEPQKPARKRVFSQVEEVPRPQPTGIPPAPANIESPSARPVEAEPEPAETPVAPEPATARPPTPDVAGKSQPSGSVEPALTLPPPAAPASKPVQRKISQPERQPQLAAPPAGPQPRPIDPAGQLADPQPLPRPDTARPDSQPEPPIADTLPEKPAPRQISMPERDKPDTHPPAPAGPQPVAAATVRQPAARPDINAAPVAATPPQQPIDDPEMPVDLPVQRQISMPERDEPDIPPAPAGPQPLDIALSGQLSAPAALPRPDISAEPAAALRQQQFIDDPVAPADLSVQRQAAIPERDEPETHAPAGPQLVEVAASSQPDMPEPLPRQSADPSTTLRQAQPISDTQMPADLPIQPQAAPPEPDQPATARPVGPQPPQLTTGGQPRAPESLPRPETGDSLAVTGQPEQLFAQAPDRAVSPGLKTGISTGQPAVQQAKVLQPAETSSKQEPVTAETAPATAREELPAAYSHPGPETVAQPSAGLHQTGPAPARPTLEQNIQRRAEARTRLPLNRPQPPAGPKPLGRPTGGVAGKRIMQQVLHSAQSQGPTMPLPLAQESPVSRPALPEQLPHSRGGQSAFGPAESPALTGASPQPASSVKSEEPHLAALRAIERKFGPEALASPQLRLGGLAELGLPKSVTPPRGPEALTGRQPPAIQPPQPFDIDAISLGQPKIKVVKREAPQTPALAEKKKQKTAARRSIQRRQNLVLARKPVNSGQPSASQVGSGKTESNAAGSSKQRTCNQQPDLSQLALSVYPLVKRLLAMERERRPGY